MNRPRHNAAHDSDLIWLAFGESNAAAFSEIADSSRYRVGPTTIEGGVVDRWLRSGVVVMGMASATKVELRLLPKGKALRDEKRGEVA